MHTNSIQWRPGGCHRVLPRDPPNRATESGRAIPGAIGRLRNGGNIETRMHAVPRASVLGYGLADGGWQCEGTDHSGRDIRIL